MALDTALKRASAVAISLYSMGPSVITPDPCMAADWRATVGYSYAGLTYSPPVAPVSIGFTSLEFGIVMKDPRGYRHTSPRRTTTYGRRK